MPFQNDILGGASGQGGDYTIDNSCRFGNTSESGMTWTPGQNATSLKQFTVSMWYKFAYGSATAGGGGGGNENWLFWGNGDTGYDLIRLNGTTKKILWNGGSSGWTPNGKLITWQSLRDPSAWYHLVFVWDTPNGTANDRMQIWINGSRVTELDTNTTPTQNQNANWNYNTGSTSMKLGYYSGASSTLDGYLAEVHNIDGQAKTASDFGEFNEDTGQWVPIKYSGTYGNNGWYQKYGNSASMGADSSGNGNNWSTANISANDQMIDTPSNNYSTVFSHNILPADYVAVRAGGLKLEGTSGSNSSNMTGTMMPPPGGKWYWETAGIVLSNTQWPRFGTVGRNCYSKINPEWDGTTYAGLPGGSIANSDGGYRADASGHWGREGSDSTGAKSFGAGDVVQFALDHDNGALYMGVNNTWYDTSAGANGVPTSGGSKTGAVHTWTAGDRRYVPCWQVYNNSRIVANFGQDSSFNGTETAQGNSDGNGEGDFYYTPPTGYLALCTNNLPEPAIIQPKDYFANTIYTGNGTAIGSGGMTISSLNFQPDMTIFKRRNAQNSFTLFDVYRGATKKLNTDSNGGESTQSEGLTAFNSNGWTMGNQDNNNTSGSSYVNWSWLASNSTGTNTDGDQDSTVSVNNTAGFSVIRWSGTSSQSSVGHGMNSPPTFLVIKDYIGSSTSWVCWHQDLAGGGYSVQWDTNIAQQNSGWSGTSNPPSSTPQEIKIANNSAVNGSGRYYMCYAWHEVEGFSRIDYYKGNSQTDGTFIHCGFRPAFIWVKNISQAEGWCMWDNKREPYSALTKQLGFNDDRAEYTANRTTFAIDAYSNGFKMRSTYSALNQNNQTFIFMAFAEMPFKYANAR